MSIDSEWLEFKDNLSSNSNNYSTNKINVTKKTSEIKPKCSEIYISTQTKIAYLNQKIDLNKLFWLIPIIDYYCP